MSDLTASQREEVQSMMSQNNQIMVGEIKNTIYKAIHEVIDPLKESVNKTLNEYSGLASRTTELEKKMETSFNLHNGRTEKLTEYDKDFIRVKKDIEKLQADCNGLGSKVDENKQDDEDLKERLDKAETAWKTICWIGGFVGALLTLYVSYLALKS